MMTEKKQQQWRHLGVVAGGGALPLVLAQAASARGKPVRVVRVHGFADQDWNEFPTREFKLGEMAAMCAYFKAAGVDAVTFAGNVRRPDFASFTLKKLPSSDQEALQEAARQGDDSLLRSVIAIFERAGFDVIGIADIAPEYLVQAGIAGAHDIADSAQEDCQHASEIARKIGALDIGQGAVVRAGVVLAVEAQEGTEQMLARCARLFMGQGGPAKTRSGVFAKWAKPGQDRRIDLPVIGVSTIENMARAGLAGLALEAGAVILLNPEAVIATADRLGLFILGVAAAG